MAMREIPEAQFENKPVFIKVPIPVSSMSTAQRDAFVDEILNALEEQRN